MLAMLGMALPPVLVLGAAVLAVSIASQLGFGEGRWVGGNLMPKASRLNPLSGLKRMFGLTGWIEMGKGIAKVALLGAIAWVWARERLAGAARAWPGRPCRPARLWLGRADRQLLFALSAGLLIIALIDFPVQWLRRILRLKMTMQDVRDEQKEAEGSPERRAAIRQRQRQIAMGGVAGAMREAQFVHYQPCAFRRRHGLRSGSRPPRRSCWPKGAARRRWRCANWPPNSRCRCSNTPRSPARSISPRASGR